MIWNKERILSSYYYVNTQKKGFLISVKTIAKQTFCCYLKNTKDNQVTHCELRVETSRNWTFCYLLFNLAIKTTIWIKLSRQTVQCYFFPLINFHIACWQSTSKQSTELFKRHKACVSNVILVRKQSFVSFPLLRDIYLVHTLYCKKHVCWMSVACCVV